MIDLAILVVTVHAVWLFLVIFGALWTRGHPGWSVAHVLALVWGIVVEVSPWPCPLTVAEYDLVAKAGLTAYHASSLLHFINNIVYPDLPGWIVASAGVAVCSVNLGVYGRRFWLWCSRHRSAR